jgi:hypothetical protein
MSSRIAAAPSLAHRSSASPPAALAASGEQIASCRYVEGKRILPEGNSGPGLFIAVSTVSGPVKRFRNKTDSTRVSPLSNRLVLIS